MNEQLTFLNPSEKPNPYVKEVPWRQSPAKKAADRAIKRAAEHAEQDEPGWTEKALSFLKGYCERTNYDFMAEDVRLASVWSLKLPATERVWGAVIRMAAHKGWIVRVGYRSVSNAKAHGTPAALWKSRIFRGDGCQEQDR
jgi:hypothetical protein